jgi:hypothetical protein
VGEIKLMPTIKHRMSNTPEFNIWRSMIQRCYDVNCKAYEWYGARGIKVCDSWKEAFLM